MKIGSSNPTPSKGFTFTLSIVLLSITLIAMAVFSREWRASQQASFTEILPSESQRIDSRIASDVSKMFGASADVEKQNATSASIDVTGQMPFQKEGSPLAHMDDYSQSLSSSMRASGYAAVLSTNGLSKSNATVLTFTLNGSLEYSNDGPYDIAAYYHPQGAAPAEIYVTIACNKTASSVDPLSIVGSNQTSGGYYYHINYTETSSGKTYIVDCHSPEESNTSLSIQYPDLSQIFFESSFSGSNARNRTSIHYTKSPGGFLILAFDANGTLRDYSLSGNNLSLALAPSAPTWEAEGCKNGGCYEFDGSNDFMSGDNLQLFETELPPSLGIERISNGTFENFTGGLGNNSSSWLGWSKLNSDPSHVAFHATNISVTGFAVEISNDGLAAGSNDLWQNASNLWENTPYTLSLWSKGPGGRYRIVDMTNSSLPYYLQGGGSWSTAPYDIPTGANATYIRSVNQFSLRLNSSAVRIELLPSASAGDVYYDSVSLKRTDGQNSGFESYYYDTGPGGTGFVPEATK